MTAVDANRFSHLPSIYFSFAAITARSETSLFISSICECREQIDDPIVCITSSAEDIANFRVPRSTFDNKSVTKIQSLQSLYEKVKPNTFVPPVSGRRRVFASKSAMAPATEVTCSLSSMAQSSRQPIC